MNASETFTPRMVGIGAVFIDDIVLPSGKTYMGQLGGGVVHALMGAAVWEERPGINAIIGTGLSNEALNRLEQHFDTRGLIQVDIPQIRAWQLFEEDGTRRELYRVADTRPFIVGAQPEHLPQAYVDCKGFYLLQGFEGMRAWCAATTGLVLWEPLQQIMIPGSREAIRSILQDCEISVLSPNLAEAQAVYGDLIAEDLVTAMLDDRAQTVALRMGEKGSLLVNGATGECWHIPAVAVPAVVDQTGAGNTYCGALLWGLLDGKTLAEAGVAGAVAASLCIERVGIVNPSEIDVRMRNERYDHCLATVRKG
jgi:sugar/nucleoside kinase (ribokinase family)